MMDRNVSPWIQEFYFIHIPVTTSKLSRSNENGMDSLILSVEFCG